MSLFKIDAYHEFIPENLARKILSEATDVDAISGLKISRQVSGLESPDALSFLVDLYQALEQDLSRVLLQRKKDRDFLDERVQACYEFNQNMGRDILDPNYKTVLGLQDSQGRVVMGPLGEHYCRPKKEAQSVAPIPEHLKGIHVTLFGPPDSEKMAINAMNAYHRKLANEPKIIEEILSGQELAPFWGADDEDSKTPLHKDLVDAAVNLSKCFSRQIQFSENGKQYQLASSHLSQPLKRFPGLALPASFLFYQGNPIPLHLYDFAIHLFHNWHNPAALSFYVPKLENEEEAKYIHQMIHLAEKKLQAIHSSYVFGSVRLMIVLENPRAILRAHEIMDQLYPYFAGASLGWHDYLASTARIFKNDGNYRIPVKADPDIVIKYIKASHELLADVVGTRGGIKVGGMYGILPNSNELTSESFQVTIKGFIRDIVTQLKRNLTGFWVAHPDFVRMGIALVLAWQEKENDQGLKLDRLLRALLSESHYLDVRKFIDSEDVKGLNKSDSNYVRSLIVADIKESDFIANNHPDEIRYNVFQCLQYVTDWLCGRGCVALPTNISGTSVRVMDDLATAERSRWEVWHEIFHGRFLKDELIKIVFEELRFIRLDLSNKNKIVQVKWNSETAKWYPLAAYLVTKMMTDEKPVEFASELLMPFSVDFVRDCADPLKMILEMCPEKFKMDQEVARKYFLFEFCGASRFVSELSQKIQISPEDIFHLVSSFSKEEIIEAASFHGNIGQGQKTLDANASKEQQEVFSSNKSGLAQALNELQSLGDDYHAKFGFKFLIFAQGRSAEELLAALKLRINQHFSIEMANAKEALAQIACKRFLEHQTKFPGLGPNQIFQTRVQAIFDKHKQDSMSVAIIESGFIQELQFGRSNKGGLYQIASLSKSVAAMIALDIFSQYEIDLDDSLGDICQRFQCSLSALETLPHFNEVKIRHLLNHEAFNGHYVNGFSQDGLPDVMELLTTPFRYNYQEIKILNRPGTQFSYSGAGYLILEYLLQKIAKQPIGTILENYSAKWGITFFSHQQILQQGILHRMGYLDNGQMLDGGFLSFPALAAGLSSTSFDVAKFLEIVRKSFNCCDPQSPIPHNHCVKALHGQDKGSLVFMGAKMGLGFFVAEAGDNKIIIHQGANDGFRGIYLHCVSGPDQGKGLVCFVNGNNTAVSLIAEVVGEFLKFFNFSGIDFKMINRRFDFKNLPQEQIVNLGYKKLIFDAFMPTLPPKIHRPLKNLFPFHSWNILSDAKISFVSNQRFARAENLMSPERPYFDPDLFCAQGKVMDSWESARHNSGEFDFLDLEIKDMKKAEWAFVSTEYHDGNQAQYVRILAFSEGEMTPISEKTPLPGHAWCFLKLSKSISARKFRIEIYPDGGLSRLMLFEKLPPQHIFSDGEENPQKSLACRYLRSIPKSKKPLTISYHEDANDIHKNFLKALKVDLASAAFGAKLISASNEHYGPAAQVISPFKPLHMFDGLESARSRDRGHNEEVVIGLAKAQILKRIELDFSYFVNNNPKEIQIEGFTTEGQWEILFGRKSVKEFAGNILEISVLSKSIFEQVKVKTFPDGGINRIHVF